MEAHELQQIIEALLFASEQPLTVARLREVVTDGEDLAIRQAIEALRQSYRETHRAFTIEEVAGGFQMATDPRFAPWIRTLYKEARTERLSAAGLETLAIIAYRQPLTRAEIEHIRGVNVDGVMQTLLEKGVIKILGRKEAPGRPLIYGTTKEFLQYFGLNSLADLPSLDELAKPPAPTPVAGAEGAGTSSEGATPSSDAQPQESGAPSQPLQADAASPQP